MAEDDVRELLGERRLLPHTIVRRVEEDDRVAAGEDSPGRPVRSAVVEDLAPLLVGQGVKEILAVNGNPDVRGCSPRIDGCTRRDAEAQLCCERTTFQT